MKYQSLSLKQAKKDITNFKELSTVDISNLDTLLFQNAVTSVTSGSSKAMKTTDKIRILELQGYPDTQALWARALVGSLTRTELDAKHSKIAKNDEDENYIVRRRDAWKA
jgi:hypothetical protein